MLFNIIKTTMAYLESMPKKDRKKIGQFFTSANTAQYMASLFKIPNKEHITILDPGTGTGILSAALVERVLKHNENIFVELTCYEVDENVLPVLQENLHHMKSIYGDRLDIILKQEDYILSQADDFNHDIFEAREAKKWDIVISNPPYMKIEKKHPASMAMFKVVHGSPNLYFLFMSMALFNLRPDGEMVFIVPRSWTSGAYFKAFREYLLSHGKLEYIHLFASRDKVFKEEQVLQETMIVKIKKTCEAVKKVIIASSESSHDFSNVERIKQAYNQIVVGKDKYVLLPVNQEQVSVINMVNTYDKNMPDYGYKMKTGIVVDFRQKYALRDKCDKNTIPLFYSQNIQNGMVNHNPSGKEYDWMVTDYAGLIQENKDYVFLKRFTAKEEKRRLQCGIYCSEQFKKYPYIGTHNKINFIERTDKTPFSKKEIYGIYALFNTTIYDTYYRILNGSTQVNSTELNNMPVPPMEIISKIGEKLMDNGNLDTKNCDRIVMEIAYGKENSGC